MKPDTVLVGAGRMGARHIGAALASGMEVVGVFDTNFDRALGAVTDNSLSTSVIFSDFSEMLVATKPANVIIATTADSHAQYTIKSAEFGVSRILCEKPMATSLSSAKQMIDACLKSETELLINHQVRFSARYRTMKDLIDSGRFGTISHISVVTGNIGLAMGVSHYIDLCQMILQESWKRVLFLKDLDGPTNPRGTQFYDPGGYLIAETISGKRATFSFGVSHGHGLFTTLMGDWGSIYSNDITGEISAYWRSDENRNLPSTRYATDGGSRLIKVEIEDAICLTSALWRNVWSGSERSMRLEESLSIVKLLIAAEISGANGGQWVNLNQAEKYDMDYPWA
jgi:predicted dehydrogenase